MTNSARSSVEYRKSSILRQAYCDRIDTANVIDDEDEEVSRSPNGTFSARDQFVNTLSRLRPMLANYNSEFNEVSPSVKEEEADEAYQIKQISLAKILSNESKHRGRNKKVPFINGCLSNITEE